MFLLYTFVQIIMHYTGKLQDGTEFDTSVGRGEMVAVAVIDFYVDET